MRYATVVISPNDGALHPADGALLDAPSVERRSISQVTLLEDGTAVMLYRFRGDAGRADAALDACDSVVDADVTEGPDGLAYIHIDANDTVESLLRILLEHEIVIDPPIDCITNGSVRVTLVGRSDAIRRAVDQVPDRLHVSLEGLGDYQPEHSNLAARLTERQREILEAAVGLGYYEVPRRATHDDIAAEVDLSAGTVGEHLRKVEGKVLSTLVSQ
ncbi:helix-turn-helix domain-containing protein [Halorarius halobius]|uniref:helix-turn-helix domain-containing protein n=1 Tax=Halorarius halobius TaxID=2962671 RepID=UPI0020CB736F|nr:helix-turn-helix domain-containing protein [Halorarius halobius]